MEIEKNEKVVRGTPAPISVLLVLEGHDDPAIQLYPSVPDKPLLDEDRDHRRGRGGRGPCLDGGLGRQALLPPLDLELAVHGHYTS